MNLFVFHFYFFHIILCLYGQEPISFCRRDSPFRLSANKCANFNAICMKKDDAQCNQLQNACKQCPPSDFTVTILTEILRIVKYRLLYFLITIFTFNVVVVILLVLENRFKIISKCCFSLIKQKRIDKYQLIHSRKGKVSYQNFTKDSGAKLKFSLPTKKLIELYVYGNENVISVKKRICKKWPEARAGFYKIMKLECKGVHLDDNEYLMSCFTSYKNEIICQMDYSLDISNILVLRVNGIKRDTELVQINKDKKISDLNQILCNLLNYSDSVIFVKHENEANYLDLNNHDLTLEKAGLKDNDRVVAIMKKSVKIKFSSIYGDEAPFEEELLNIENASFIYSIVKKKFKSQDFVLIMNNQDVKSDKFMFQYHIVDVGQIKYCRFYDLDALINDGKYLKESNKSKVKNHNSSKLYKGNDPISKKEVALLKYKLSNWESFKANPNLFKELVRLKLVKSHERFVKIFGIYKNKSEIGVSMELMNMSMRDVLDIPEKKNEMVSFPNIIKWSQQILDGLAFLHDHGIVYDNLTTSNILLDGKDDIKLSSISIGNVITDINIEKHTAPGLLKNESLTTKSDVWSFGIILLEIITGKRFDLSAENNDSHWLKIYAQESKFLDAKSDWFKNIIENCLIRNAINRISVKELQFQFSKTN